MSTFLPIFKPVCALAVRFRTERGYGVVGGIWRVNDGVYVGGQA